MRWRGKEQIRESERIKDDERNTYKHRCRWRTGIDLLLGRLNIMARSILSQLLQLISHLLFEGDGKSITGAVIMLEMLVANYDKSTKQKIDTRLAIHSANMWILPSWLRGCGPLLAVATGCTTFLLPLPRTKNGWQQVCRMRMSSAKRRAYFMDTPAVVTLLYHVKSYIFHYVLFILSCIVIPKYVTSSYLMLRFNTRYDVLCYFMLCYVILYLDRSYVLWHNILWYGYIY